jgi:carbonic anhydrase/acetyltransferase-like protein (isoleucine patch superfamily)
MLGSIAKNFRIVLGRMVRESGQALDRSGSRLTNDVAYLERNSRHRRIFPLAHLWPSFGKSFIAPSACLSGEVQVGDNCVVGYGVSIRGDFNAVRLRDNIAIGDNSSIVNFQSLPPTLPKSTNINSNVLVGEQVTLISCSIDSFVHIGSGSVVQQGAKLERGCVLQPNSVVNPGTTVPAYTVWAGNPAQYVRDANPEDVRKFESALISQIEQGQASAQVLRGLGHRLD